MTAATATPLSFQTSRMHAQRHASMLELFITNTFADMQRSISEQY